MGMGAVSSHLKVIYQQHSANTALEVQVQALGYYLDGVKNVHLSPVGSEADVCLKVDLFLELEGEICLGIQVKSSEHYVREPLEPEKVMSAGRAYLTAPVVVMDHPLLLLHQLAEASTLLIREEVHSAIELAFYMAQTVKEFQPIPSGFIKTAILRIWRELGLVRLKGRDIIFTPPPVNPFTDARDES